MDWPDSYKFEILAWPEPHAVCGRRTGYQALVEVCDRLGACTNAISPRFTVRHPMNGSAAIAKMKILVQANLDAGPVYIF